MARPSAAQSSSARTDSQRQAKVLQELFKKPKRDDKELDKICEKIKQDQRELRALVKEKLRQAETRNERRKEDLEALITRTWRSVSPEDDSANVDYASYPDTRIALNKADEAAACVLKHIKSLIGDFRAIEDVVEEAHKDQKERTVADKWIQEIQETERLLGLGCKKALRDARRLLGMGHKADKNAEGTGDKMGGVVNGEDGDGAMELQTALRYVERGVKRMTKCIPPEEAENST